MSHTNMLRNLFVVTCVSVAFCRPSLAAPNETLAKVPGHQMDQLGRQDSSGCTQVQRNGETVMRQSFGQTDAAKARKNNPPRCDSTLAR